LDSVASNELVRTLLDLLQCNFATVANSEELLSAEPASQTEGGKDITRLIVCGGSNMSKIVPILTNMGYTVVDLSTPGWTPTEGNILSLKASIQQLSEIPGTVVILDLLGNVAFRQAQLDGTLALPYKSGGKHHIEGKVHVCNHSSLSTIVNSLKPVLEVLIDEFLFCSPIPRFLFNGCCTAQDHCGVPQLPFAGNPSAERRVQNLYSGSRQEEWLGTGPGQKSSPGVQWNSGESRWTEAHHVCGWCPFHETWL
jgi:hypothetical protein